MGLQLPMLAARPWTVRGYGVGFKRHMQLDRAVHMAHLLLRGERALGIVGRAAIRPWRGFNLDMGTEMRYTRRLRWVLHRAWQIALLKDRKEASILDVLVAVLDARGVGYSAMRELRVDIGTLRKAILHRLDLDEAALKQSVMRRIVNVLFAPEEEPRLSAEVGLMMEQAQAEAQHLNHNYVGTEHIVIAVLEDRGEPALLLERLGVTTAELRQALRRLLG